MENNYPKKYAIMTLYDYAGLDLITGSPIIMPYSNIIVECYIIAKKLINDKVKYEVVFTKDPHTTNSVEPKYFPNNECYNSNLVDRVFNTFEDAIQYRNFRNQDLKVAYLMKTNLDLNAEFIEKIGYDDELETKLLKKTKTKIKKLID